MNIYGPYLRCGACLEDIKEAVYCACVVCKNRLHEKCIYDSVILNEADATNSTCICSECKSKTKKGDNTNTPLRKPDPEGRDEYANVTQRRDKKTLTLDSSLDYIEHSNNDMALLLQEMRQIKIAVEILTKQSQEIALLRKEVQDLKNQLNATQPDSHTIATRDNEISELKATVTHLQNSLRVQEQLSLKNELEIAGIPEQESENLNHIVFLASKKLGIELVEADIDGIFRAGPSQAKAVNRLETVIKMPRPIVVKLVRRAKRDQLIKAAKIRSNLTSEGIANGAATRLYFNERLTKDNRILFRDARLRTKQHNFRFCWVSDGCIYARKAEKKPAIPIRSQKDLDHHVGLAS